MKYTGMDADRMFGQTQRPSFLNEKPSPSATAFALGKAWARRYGKQGARELADALLRGISDE